MPQETVSIHLFNVCSLAILAFTGVLIGILREFVFAADPDLK